MRVLESFACVLLVSIALVQCSSPDAEVIKTCMEKNHIAAGEFKALIDSQTLPNEEQIKNAKCFTHCFLNEMGLFDDKGKLDLEKVSESRPMDSKETEMIDKCAEAYDAEADPCEYSFRVALCVLKGFINMGLQQFMN